MPRPRALLLLALPALILLPACARRESAVESGLRTQFLQAGNGVEPSSLDPQRNTGSPEANIIRELYDSLVIADPESLGAVKPNGATHWEISPDGLAYTFHLRPDSRWSNGDPVTAEDYRASLIRLLEPDLGATLANLAYPLAGAEDYHRGRSKDPASIGVTTDGPHVLRLRLRSPLPQLLNYLETYPFVAVHRTSVEAGGNWLNPSSPWTRPGQMITNGPYRLKSWTPNRPLILERNPHYRDPDRVKLAEIHYHPIESLDTEERAFRTGQLHLTSGVPASKVPAYREANDRVLHISPRLGLHYLNLNTERPTLKDARVRRALAFAIDRRQLATQVLGRGETPAESLGQPGMGGYAPRHRLAGGPEEARRLLAAAGFPGGAGFPRLSYLYNTSERNRDVAEALQQMWRRELGIDVELRNEEWKVFLSSRQRGQYDLARAGWNPFTPECAELFLLCHGSSEFNDSRWHHAGYDELYARASTTLDVAARHELYQQLDQLILEEMPIIPLAYNSAVRLIHPSVQGWRDNLRDTRELCRLFLAPGFSR
jgi:oligopeptide transport system substrate-binding protein